MSAPIQPIFPEMQKPAIVASMRAAILLLPFVLAACDKQPVNPDAEIGRFAIQEANGKVLLLDTDQGRAWQLVEREGGASYWA